MIRTFTSLTGSDSRYCKENDNGDQSRSSDVDLLTNKTTTTKKDK